MTLVDTPPPNGLTSAPPPSAPTHAPGDREMTMLEHLIELRNRLVSSVIAVLVGIIVSIIPIPGWDSLAHFIFARLTYEASQYGVVIQAIGPGETFFAYIQVCMVVGVSIAMPVIIYHLMAFVSPALYDNEKKYLYFAVPGVMVSFLAGVAFCYFWLLPFAIHYLSGFGADIVAQQWTVERYLSFVTTFMFWLGVIFELPLIMFFLTRLGVVSVQRLTKMRKYAFVMAFVIGAVITPTPDPFNQTLVSLPIYLLFELGIILARFA